MATSFDRFMYGLLNSGQAPHPGVGGGMPNALLAAEQSAPAAPAPVQQAAQPAAMGYQAPEQGNSGGFLSGLGNAVQGLLAPGSRGRNATVGWLQSQGLDEGTATLLAGNKPALQKFLIDRAQGADPMDALKLEKTQLEIEQMRNPTTDDIREYNFAKKGGYQGSFTDFMQSNRKAGATNVNIGQSEYGTIPQGYQLTRGPDGSLSMQPIPGGPADKSEEVANSQTTKTDVITNAYKTANDLIGPTTTGLVGAGAAYLSPSDAAELRRQVKVLTSNATIENLNAMRQQSPTGGALGNVTEGEGKMLAAAAGALDPNAGTQQFKTALDNYYHTLLRIVNGPEAGDRMFAEIKGGRALAPEQGRALDRPQTSQPSSFSSQADIGAAINAGKVRDGDIIILNGKRQRVNIQQ